MAGGFGNQAVGWWPEDQEGGGEGRGVGEEDALGTGDGGDPQRALSSQPRPQPLPRGALAS